MLALSFLFPAVLYAGAAAAAPVLIHLILRTKPRRTVFPAMRFVRKTHRSTLKMLRLKHLILLAMRMGVVALMAALIARGQVPRWQPEDRSAPTAAVVVIDNSGSMNYLYQGQTILSWSRQQAQRILATLPAGSRAAVIATSGQRAPSLVDPSLAVQQVVEVPESCHSAGVGAALRQAEQIVRRSGLARKEVFLLTDLTARSWPESLRVEDGAEVHFAILHTGGEDLNVRLGELRLSGTAAPVGGEVRIDTTVGSVNVGGSVPVVAELDGEQVSDELVGLPAGGEAAVRLAVRPSRQGVAHGRVFLRNADPLAMDNERFFTLQVGPPAKALIVCSPSSVVTTGFLMGNAVAPASGHGPVQRDTITAEQLGAGRLTGARLVILAEAASLSDSQWRLLEPFVRNGGGLWVVSGPLMSVESYNSPLAQRLMPVGLAGLEQVPQPAEGPAASRPGGSPLTWGQADTEHPMLQPFRGSGNPSLSEVRCTARFRTSSRAEDAQVILEYADGAPAIVVRRAGEGTVVFWNFSPLPGLSNLSTRAQFPILCRRTASVLTAEAGAQTAYEFGQEVVVPIPRGMASAVATVRRPGSDAEQPLLPDPGRPVVRMRADALGGWTVRFAQADQQVQRGFSANADPAESDLTPIAPGELARRFETSAGADGGGKPLPPERVTVASDVSQITHRRRTVAQPLDLTPAVLLGLLALMTGESFFANRFYRRAEAPAVG